MAQNLLRYVVIIISLKQTSSPGVFIGVLKYACCMEQMVLPDSQTTVLVIEIDDAFRRHLAERLRMENFKVYEACQKVEALQILKGKNIDVVLLGKREFKQDGLILLRSIKEMKQLTEVILMTPSESASLSASIQAMKLGAFDDLKIPFEMKTLIAQITAAHQRKTNWKNEKRLGLSPKIPHPGGGT
jgi:DNA-binding NtrC family response regulator